MSTFNQLKFLCIDEIIQITVKNLQLSRTPLFSPDSSDVSYNTDEKNSEEKFVLEKKSHTSEDVLDWLLDCWYYVRLMKGLYQDYSYNALVSVLNIKALNITDQIFILSPFLYLKCYPNEGLLYLDVSKIYFINAILKNKTLNNYLENHVEVINLDYQSPYEVQTLPRKITQCYRLEYFLSHLKSVKQVISKVPASLSTFVIESLVGCSQIENFQVSCQREIFIQYFLGIELKPLRQNVTNRNKDDLILPWCEGYEPPLKNDIQKLIKNAKPVWPNLTDFHSKWSMKHDTEGKWPDHFPLLIFGILENVKSHLFWNPFCFGISPLIYSDLFENRFDYVEFFHFKTMFETNQLKNVFTLDFSNETISTFDEELRQSMEVLQCIIESTDYQVKIIVDDTTFEDDFAHPFLTEYPWFPKLIYNYRVLEFCVDPLLNRVDHLEEVFVAAPVDGTEDDEYVHSPVPFYSGPINQLHLDVHLYDEDAYIDVFDLDFWLVRFPNAHDLIIENKCSGIRHINVNEQRLKSIKTITVECQPINSGLFNQISLSMSALRDLSDRASPGTKFLYSPLKGTHDVDEIFLLRAHKWKLGLSTSVSSFGFN